MASNALQCLGPVDAHGYNQETADTICERIASGETLSAICQDEDMPGRTTVWKWMQRPDFREQYARAREAQGDFEFDEIRQISDNAGDDPGAVQKARLQVETRKWRAERLNRQAYGQKVAHEHDIAVHSTIGEEGLPPSLGFLRGRLLSAERDPEPVDSPVGEG